jgi:hypothetical protein
MKYCIKYRIVDYPMGASPAYLYIEAGLNLTKEAADVLVEKLNHEDDLRLEKIKSEGKHTTVYYDYFATKVE